MGVESRGGGYNWCPDFQSLTPSSSADLGFWIFVVRVHLKTQLRCVYRGPLCLRGWGFTDSHLLAEDLLFVSFGSQPLLTRRRHSIILN